jgi:hypothetical protein
MHDDAALLLETFRLRATFPSTGVPGATLRHSSGLTWVDSGLDTDTFNVVLGARLAPGEVGLALQQVLSHFESVRRPFSWRISPGDEPEDLAARLASLGLVYEEGGGGGRHVCPHRGHRRNSRAPGNDDLASARREVDLALCALNAENWPPPVPPVERYFGRPAGRLEAAPAAAGLYGRIGFSSFAQIGSSSLFIVSDKIYYVKSQFE